MAIDEVPMPEAKEIASSEKSDDHFVSPSKESGTGLRIRAEREQRGAAFRTNATV